MALYKKEILIKPSSILTHDEAIQITRDYVNSFQNDPANTVNGNFVDYFFGDVFDSRTGSIHRVFSDACTTFYELPNVNGLIKYPIYDINSESFVVA